uniref:Nucleoporin NUP42 n=1 Tax=Saimiri boliviensis boliviensis TaxID=39432 RepID=A0A2K6U8Y6_SAIBB
MAICQFFLQGRCRFGDRCWNEHPGARGAGGGRQPPQQQLSGDSPLTPPRWPEKPPTILSLIDSHCFALYYPSLFIVFCLFCREGIVKDMEVWESSGQWIFSVYSPVKKKPNISGFTDISPEELRLEYHNFLTSNNLQSYIQSVIQINILIDYFFLFLFFVGFPVNNSSSDNAQNFSFKTNSGFATASSGSPAVWGSSPAFGATASTSSAISTSAPAFGFGKPEITSAASFSFKSPADSSFGSPGFSGLPTSLATGPISAPVAPAFGGGSSVAGFGSPGSHSHTAFSKPSNDTFGNSSISTSFSAPSSIIATDNVLFTPRDKLTVQELEQFQSKKFTLGKIPLKPPPLELLNI